MNDYINKADFSLLCLLRRGGPHAHRTRLRSADDLSPTLSFLGLLLDSLRQEIRLPPAKLEAMLLELQRWTARKVATKRPAQSVLPSWNGTAKFVSVDVTTAVYFDLFTDASGTLGCRGYFRGEWFHYDWRPHQRPHQRQQSIQWKELFAVVAAARTWGSARTGKRIHFYCDNQAVVLSWEARRCKEPHLMALLRTLFFVAASHHFYANLTRHDRRMLAAALTTAFHGFSRVSEFTTPSPAAFNPYQATAADIRWHTGHFTFTLNFSKTCIPERPRRTGPHPSLWRLPVLTLPWAASWHDGRSPHPTRPSCSPSCPNRPVLIRRGWTPRRPESIPSSPLKGQYQCHASGKRIGVL